jgi:O-antigen/teichoic acid export membrane protein
VLGAYLCGVQRFDLFNVLAVASTAVRAILVVIVLELGRGVVAVAAVTLITSILSLLLHRAVVRRSDPEVALSLRQANWKRVRELGSFSFYVLLNSMGDYLRFCADSIVIGRFLMIALITPFSVAGRLMDYFRTIISGMSGPLVPKMSEMIGRGKSEAVVGLFLKGTQAAALLSGFIGAMVFLNGKALLHFWVGQRFESSYDLLLILTVGYVFTLAQLPANVVIYAFARHQLLGWWTLVEGAMNLMLSIYWGRQFGLVGVALGTTVPMLVTALIFLPWNVLPLLRLRARDYIRDAIARPVIASAAFIGLCYLALGGKQPDNVWMFGGTLIWQTALFAVLAYAVGVSACGRQAIAQRFNEALRRLKRPVQVPAELGVESRSQKWGHL